MIPPILGVIGTSDGSEHELESAVEVGRLAAKKGWIVVCGGLGGVMEATSRGAYEADGIVIGILPGGSIDDANKYVTIPIATNMGHARNIIIAHTSDAIIAVGGGLGTLSEIAIARKLGKPVFSIGSWEVADVTAVADAKKAIEACQNYLDKILKKM